MSRYRSSLRVSKGARQRTVNDSPIVDDPTALGSLCLEHPDSLTRAKEHAYNIYIHHLLESRER